MHKENGSNSDRDFKKAKEILLDFEKRLLKSSFFDEKNYLIPALLIGIPIFWGIINFPPS